LSFVMQFSLRENDKSNKFDYRFPRKWNRLSVYKLITSFPVIV